MQQTVDPPHRLQMNSAKTLAPSVAAYRLESARITWDCLLSSCRFRFAEVQRLKNKNSLDGFFVVKPRRDSEMLPTDDDDLCIFILGALQPGSLPQVDHACVARH